MVPDLTDILQKTNRLLFIGVGNVLKSDNGVGVIIDCMELGSKPGTFRLLTLDKVEEITFNTHNISLARLGDFFNYPTFVLGIQPQNVAFGDELSPPVLEAANKITNKINQNIN